jgi:TonB-linked SusC/RagA family outer membrane protein
MALGTPVRSRPQRQRGRKGAALALLGLAAFASLSSDASAQQQTGQITGIVTDATAGTPLAEVQIFLVGQSVGTISRANGRYLIPSVPVGTYELRAQRIGFGEVTQSVTVTAGATLEVNLTMATQALGLDEIVVTGTAGASRRREVGNSVSQINIASVAERPANVTSLLQGAAPGVEVTAAGGEAGMGKNIRLRGIKSVSMTNQPIIYIDGIRMMDQALPTVDIEGLSGGEGALVTPSALDQVNPADIERIEIIKGSAATTLYGTEASAGVIQIFTKRGSSGAPVWTAEVQQGTGWVQKFGPRGDLYEGLGVDYLNMEHFLRDAWWGGGYEGGPMAAACVTNDGKPGSERWEGVNKDPAGACSWPGTQWYTNYHLSVRGGGQALQYYLSGQYQDDSYTLPNDELSKYNFQGNFTMTPVENLQLQWNTGYSNQWLQNTPSGNNLSGIELQTFRQERNYFANGDPRVIAVLMDYVYDQTVERLTTGITATYSPLAAMTNRFTVGYDHVQNEVRNLIPFGYWEFPDGAIVSGVFQKRLLTFDYVSTLRFGVTDNVVSNFSIGGQAIGDTEHRVQAQGENFPGAEEPTVSSGAVQRASEDREKVWNAGFFLQNVLDISNKYFITAGVRVDGNSAFGSGFGLQVYPKVSGSWVISDEGFWSPAWGSLKLRAAYGQSGRAPGAFDAVRTWNPVGFAGSPAFTPDNRGNPDLGPEVTGEFEAGFDGSWVNDRLRATFTYFSQKTSDALMNVSTIPSSGFGGSQLENVGTLTNKGLELQLDANVVQTQGWGLDLGLGVSTNKSEVIDIGDLDPFNALSGRIREGYPAPAAWDDRRVANRDEAAPFQYVRCEGDDCLPGIPVGDTRQSAGIYIGSLYPTHFITPSVSLRVPGNVLLSARGEYRGGHWREVNPISISRSVRSPLCFPYYQNPENSITLKSDTPAIWRERCTPANGDDYWFDADYFKLRTFTATVPVDFAFPETISNATLTLTLANAFDWHREIPWWDTEMGSDSGARTEAVASQTERTPAPATLRLALRVTF